MKRTSVILIVLSLLITLPVFSMRRSGNLSFYGTVSTIENSKKIPVEFAALIIQPSGYYAITDSLGHYCFDKLEPGKYDLSIQLIGYVTIDTTIVLSENRTKYNFILNENTFRLNEVNVIAEHSNASGATSSKISRQAIDHSQTASLADIMSLLPGADFTNPDLSSTKTISLRTAMPTSMNSLGTSIIVDGSPLSNNANMEGLNTAITGVSSTIVGSAVSMAGSIPNGGLDVRSISTDNIESVDVIRGIPSVKYGDITSGAVVINSKAGIEPLNIKLKTDPKIYQIYISKGLKLNKNLGELHLSTGYTYSNAKTTERYAYYQRCNIKGLWTKKFDKLFQTTSIEFKFGKDTRNKNPDDKRSSTASAGTDLGYRINTTGTWNINKGWIKTLKYSASNSFHYRKSFYEQDCINALNIYSTNMTDGTTVSNIKGKRIYDVYGQEITNFGEDGMNRFATFMPYYYFSHYDFYSKELNIYAQVILNLHKSWEATSENILIGTDFKSDGNLGRGLVFKEGCPPPKSPNPESGYRSRPLYEVPFINQYSVFAENVFKTTFLNRNFLIISGLRYDYVNGLKCISPRINTDITLLRDILSLRAGYGITAKAPTSGYLYPNNAYYDQANYNSLDADDPAKRLVIATTYVFDTKNPNLQMATNRKIEVGADIKFMKKYKFAITFFDELMENGYDFNLTFSSIHYMPFRYYVSKGADSEGNPTLLRSVDTHKFFLSYMPTNSRWQQNRGIEYEMDLGRFDKIRTSLSLNGAWVVTRNSSTGYSFDINAIHGSTLKSHVAVYDPMTYTYEYEKAMAALRITHNIPSIGFVVTLTSGLSIFTKSRTLYKNETFPKHYISNDDGKVYPFTAEMASNPAFSYMIDPLSNSRFITERHKSSIVFNINVSKEIKNFLTASFYVNNLFNYRPLDQSEVSKGSYTELNNPIYFGFELKMKLF